MPNRSGSVLKVVLLVVAVVLVAILAYRQVQRVRGPKVEVWAARADLPAGAIITADDIEAVTVRERDLPRGAVTDRAALEGRQIGQPLAAGQPFTLEDLRTPSTPTASAASMARMLPEGRVLTPVAAAIENAVLYELRFGDRLDLLASAGERVSVVARDAFFFAWVNPDLQGGSGGGRGGESEAGASALADLLRMPPRAGGTSGGGGAARSKLLLALHPDDVLDVVEANAGGLLSIVLHGKREVAKNRQLEVPGTTTADVDLIAGPRRETVAFQLPRQKPRPKLRSFVVLLPKQDGSVGEIDVLVGGRKKTLTGAGEGLDFEDPDRLVSVIEPEIQEALRVIEAAEPVEPALFVVYFPSGAAEPTAESRGEWAEILAAVESRPAAEITVSGHTDSAGADAFNRALSRERATAIRDALERAGVDAGRIALEAWGESRPAVVRPNGQAEPRNRRVVIRVR